MQLTVPSMAGGGVSAGGSVRVAWSVRTAFEPLHKGRWHAHDGDNSWLLLPFLSYTKLSFLMTRATFTYPAPNAA